VQAILATSGRAIPAAAAIATCRCSPSAGVPPNARAAGFVRVGGRRPRLQLAALVAQSCDRCAGPLLFACGRDQGQALAGDLRARGFAVVRRVVYAASPPGTLPETARAAFASGSLTAALFFSAETARHCVRLLRAARLHEAVRSVDALAIGRPAAVALQELTWRRTSVAAQPNRGAMLSPAAM
jgi:uroporphyrinogen-III synthase